MSKMDALRAMREARYAQGAGSTKPEARVTPLPKAAPREAEVTASVDGGLCGHRSMNGRSCTRELGHSAKSHRYS